MAQILNCEYCGSTFLRGSSMQRFCTVACRNKFNREKEKTMYLMSSQGVVPIHKPNKSITEISREAKKLGLTYGQYVAKYAIL